MICLKFVKEIISLVCVSLPALLWAQGCPLDTVDSYEKELEFDFNYTPYNTRGVIVTRKSTIRKIKNDSNIKFLIVWNKNFRLKNDFKFNKNLELLIMNSSSKKNTYADTAVLKTPLLKTFGAYNYLNQIPNFVLTSTNLQRIDVGVKSVNVLSPLERYNLLSLFIDLETIDDNFIPNLIYNFHSLRSLAIDTKEKKELSITDSLLKLTELEYLTLPICLNDSNLEILSNLKLCYLCVNRVKLNDVTLIEKKLKYVKTLKVMGGVSLDERWLLRQGNPSIKIEATIIRKK